VKSSPVYANLVRPLKTKFLFHQIRQGLETGLTSSRLRISETRQAASLPRGELNPALRLHSAVFSTSNSGAASAKPQGYVRSGLEMSRLERVCARWLENGCTNSGQSLVDELHSIDFTRDKSARFCLTLNLKGVKTHSFFDNF
jgi:hypothetical protein